MSKDMCRPAAPGAGVTESGVTDKKLLKVGAIGTVVAALCCFTPILVVVLGAVGLSAMLGWLDYVLIPALLAFLGLTCYALLARWKRRTA